MYSLSEKAAFEQDSIRSIEIFCRKFKVSATLKKSNAYKKKGVPTIKLIKYLCCLVFFGRSLFQDLRSKTTYASGFGKDTIYRFMNESTFNWQTFTLTIAYRLVNFFDSLTSEKRRTALIIDDSVYHRPHSKKMELSSRVYDHADGKNKYKTGFRMLTLGWTDGFSFVPLAFRHLASSDKKNCYCEANPDIDKRTNGGKLRKEAVMKATGVMIILLENALKAGIKTKYVLFDTWFGHPATINKVAGLGLDVVCRVKNSSKLKFLYQGKMYSTSEIHRDNKKRRGRSKYLLSVDITVCDKDGNSTEAKLVYIRDRGNSKKWIALLSTDTNINEEEIIALYGKRWDIEVFFKMCKSYLALAKEFQQLSYDAVIAHTAIVMLRYMILAYEKRKSKDKRSLCEYFFDFYDEAADLKYENALLMILQILNSVIRDSRIGLTDEQIQMVLETFMLEIPEHMRICLMKDTKNTA